MLGLQRAIVGRDARLHGSVRVAIPYLLATHQPNLLTVHLIGVDNFQHEQGRDGPMIPRAVTGSVSQMSRLTAMPPLLVVAVA